MKSFVTPTPWPWRLKEPFSVRTSADKLETYSARPIEMPSRIPLHPAAPTAPAAHHPAQPDFPSYNAPMPHIQRLDPVLVNKIAAGEVIERPASVVKELMENALDAGATRIDVTLEDGGTTLISISDDGGGIEPDELPLAVAPHATSKIRTVDDLNAIGTMGFRGEALASIGSIARLRIVSRKPDRLDAACIECSDGRVGDATPCAAPPGTTVEVRNLFFNVPARRKYLRTIPAELGHVTEQIARIALARPDVAISQMHQGRAVRRLPATTDRRARIGDFFGPELAADLIGFRRQEPDLRIEGWFAPPAASRASGKWQYVFLNGRFIRDRDLSGFVLREAFRGLIEPARYPVVFLFLTADPASYDVNVHPTKIEVRWRDAGRVKSQVLGVLRETLLSHDLTPSLRTQPANAGAQPTSADTVANMNALAERLKALGPPTAGGAQRSVDAGAPTSLAATVHSDRWRESARSEGATQPSAELMDSPRPTRDVPLEARLDAAAMIGREARRPDDACDASAAPSAAPDSAAANSAAARIDEGPVPRALPGRALQIHNTYLVCETPDGMLIIDQHALHERILYEELKARMTRGPLESQRLLLPETLDASPEQLAALEGAADLLLRLGLEIELFGPRSVIVRACPSLLGDLNVRELAADLLDKLADSERRDPESIIHAVLDMMACKAAVKAGDRLTPEAIEALLARRHLVERSSNCPHGRPTTLRLSLRDLERQFKRT